MNRKFILATCLPLLLTGCQSNQPILEGALQGAINSVTRSARVSSGNTASSSSDYLTSADVRRSCRYFSPNKCSHDYGQVTVSTERNRNNLTLIRYGKLIEGSSGGQLKHSKVHEQMFPYVERGFIDFDTSVYVDNKSKAIRPGDYYFKGSYGTSSNPSLAVGTIRIKAGVTNVVHVTYD